MNYLGKLKECSNQFKELALFKEGDQITVSSGKIQKTTASTSILYNTFWGQNSEDAIRKINTLIVETKRLLDNPSHDPLTIFKRLKHLSSLKASAAQAVGTSLEAFKDTCQKGKAAVLSPTKTRAEDLGNQVENLRTTLLEKIIPLLDQEIDHIHATLELGKLAQADNLITFLFTGEAPINLCLISQKSYSARHIKSTLTAFFGERIVKEIFSFYHLDAKGVLKNADIQALTVGIKANLTQDDIAYLVKNKTFLQNTFPQTLKIEFLDEKATLDILDKLRNTYCRKEIDFSQSSSSYALQLQRDLLFLEVCDHHKLYGWNKDFTHSLYKLQHYGESEFLSKDFIYGLYSTPGAKFSNGVLFPCYTMNRGDEGKKLSCFQALHLPGGEGFYPALIIPAVPQENVPLKAKIIFRGTADNDSLWRDFSLFEIKSFGTIEGAGAKSFEEKLPALKEGLKFAFEGVQQKFKIPSIEVECLGHSLGASDAARFLVDLVKQLTAMLDVYPSIKLFSYGSPGISEKECMDYLSHGEKSHEVPIHSTYFKVVGDIYQEGGLMLPGYFTEKQPMPKNVSTTVIVLDRVNIHNQDGCMALINDGGCGVAVDHTIQHTVTKHGQRCFTINDDTRPSEKNPTFVVGIYTNNKDDSTLPNAITDPDLIPQHLIARPGYAIKAIGETVQGALQFFGTPSKGTETAKK